MAYGPWSVVGEKGIGYEIANGRQPSRYKNRSIGQLLAALAELHATCWFGETGNLAGALGRTAGK